MNRPRRVGRSGGRCGRRAMLCLAFWSLTAVLSGAIDPAAAAPRLRQGDVLISDGANGRILYVDPETGHSEVFSPRGAAPNLLDHPRGIEIDAQGVVFVANQLGDDLVAIDPTSGAQSVVHARSGFQDLGVLPVGTSPVALDLSTWIGTLSDLPDLFILRPGEILRVSRGTLNTSVSSVSTDPALAQSFRSLAVRESGASLLDLFVAGVSGLGRVDPATGAFGMLVASTTSPTSYFSVGDVDWTPARLTFSAQAPCGDPGGASGVYEYPLTTIGPIVPLLTGDLVSCPKAHRQVSPTEIYVIEGGSFPNSLVRVSQSGAGWQGEVVGPLPDGDFFHLAVSPVTFAPEPEAETGAGAMLLALAGVAARRRSARATRAANVAPPPACPGSGPPSSHC